MRFAAGDDFRAFGDGVGNMFFNFGDGFLVDQRAGGDAILQAVADAQFFHRLLQFFSETVIHPVLDVQSVGADAGLPGVAELRRQRPFDGFIKVGIIKDDKRRVAAEFQGDFLMSFAHCSISWRPISVEPVKESLRTSGLLVSSPPTAPAEPVTTLNTPAGIPARLASSASASAENGVWLAGFRTMVQPAASAGPALRVIIAAGKFHGVMAAVTPMGCLITSRRLSA